MSILPESLKKLILACYLIFIGTMTYAQQRDSAAQPFHLGIGAEVGLPTGSLDEFYNFSLAGTLRIQYDFQSPVSVMLTTGFTNFFGKQNTLSFTNAAATGGYIERFPGYRFVPIKAGIKTYAASGIYFSAEGGAAVETAANGNTKLILAPGFGYAPLRSGLDVGLRYDNISGQRVRYGQFVLAAAYGF